MFTTPGRCAPSCCPFSSVHLFIPSCSPHPDLWRFLFRYTGLVLLLKFVWQLPLFCQWLDLESATANVWEFSMQNHCLACG